MLDRFLPLAEPVQGQTHQLPSLGKLWRLLHDWPKRRASVGEALSFEGLCPFMEPPDKRLRAGITDYFLEGDGRILHRMRTTGEPASTTGWSTPAAACDRPVGLPLEIRGRWKVTLAWRLLRLLRRLGRPLGIATGPLGFALLVLLALGDRLGILVLHVPGTAAGDFFVVVGDITSMDAKGADPGFAVFGRVLEGMDVIRRILVAPTSPTLGEGVMKGQMLAPTIRIESARRLP